MVETDMSRDMSRDAPTINTFNDTKFTQQTHYIDAFKRRVITSQSQSSFTFCDCTAIVTSCVTAANVIKCGD